MADNVVKRMVLLRDSIQLALYGLGEEDGECSYMYCLFYFYPIVCGVDTERSHWFSYTLCSIHTLWVVVDNIEILIRRTWVIRTKKKRSKFVSHAHARLRVKTIEKYCSQ